MPSNRKYYLVKLNCVYNDTSNFKIVDNKECWLGLSDGYYMIETWRSAAHKFDSPPTATFIRQQSGHPWYYKIKDFSIIEVTETFSSSERTI